MANCDIMIHVDINGLSQDDVWSNVSLTDCNGDIDTIPGDARTFDTKVNGSTNITWKAESGDGVDSIQIKNILVTSAFDVFESGKDPSGPDNHGWWSAKVKSNKNNPKSISSEYKISFQVNGQGTTYDLDPKMQVNPNS